MKKIILMAFLLAVMGSYAQNETYPESGHMLTKKIILLDNDAFSAYNTCDIEKFKTFFSDDLEFYHDKGGYTKGIDKFIDTFKNNLCNEPKPKVIRKTVDGTLKVYPLEGYGAVLTGDHDFYNYENGAMKKTGTAKFTHIWLLKDGYWKMTRVISYDHKPAQ